MYTTIVLCVAVIITIVNVVWLVVGWCADEKAEFARKVRKELRACKLGNVGCGYVTPRKIGILGSATLNMCRARLARVHTDKQPSKVYRVSLALQSALENVVVLHFAIDAALEHLNGNLIWTDNTPEAIAQLIQEAATANDRIVGDTAMFVDDCLISMEQTARNPSTKNTALLVAHEFNDNVLVAVRLTSAALRSRFNWAHSYDDHLIGLELFGKLLDSMLLSQRAILAKIREALSPK